MKKLTFNSFTDTLLNENNVCFGITGLVIVFTSISVFLFSHSWSLCFSLNSCHQSIVQQMFHLLIHLSHPSQFLLSHSSKKRNHIQNHKLFPFVLAILIFLVETKIASYILNSRPLLRWLGFQAPRRKELVDKVNIHYWPGTLLCNWNALSFIILITAL